MRRLPDGRPVHRRQQRHRKGKTGIYAGLGLLPVTTSFRNYSKKLNRVTIKKSNHACLKAETLTGHEIRMDEPERLPGSTPLFVTAKNGRESGEGCISADGKIVGTSLHGILGSRELRDSLFLKDSMHKMISAITTPESPPDSEIDRVAQAQRENFYFKKLLKEIS